MSATATCRSVNALADSRRTLLKSLLGLGVAGAVGVGGQYPAAAILSCIDSRAPAEIILDTGIGETFNARVAGNIANDDLLRSLEFACAAAGAKLILVMGHTACVQRTVDEIRRQSSVLAPLEQASKIRIVGLMYHLDGGRLEVLA